jgi:hypothetical protein
MLPAVVEVFLKSIVYCNVHWIEVFDALSVVF